MRHHSSTISRFFFSCLFMGAVCGMVGGLMDSAESEPRPPSVRLTANSVIPVDFIRFSPGCLVIILRSPDLHARYILTTVWNNSHAFNHQKRNHFELGRCDIVQCRGRGEMRPRVPGQDGGYLHRSAGGA